jgi:hypothetical protein
MLGSVERGFLDSFRSEASETSLALRLPRLDSLGVSVTFDITDCVGGEASAKPSTSTANKIKYERRLNSQA